MRRNDALPTERGVAGLRRRLPADARRRIIVEHAFHALATHGFEGLRLRDVAEAAGINSATLHYYFPTKQDLVEAVAQYLGEQFAALRAPVIDAQPNTPEPLLRLRQELADALYCSTAHPELLTVQRELALRATRDPSVRALIAPLNATWQRSLARIVADGQRTGVFRRELEPEATAAVVVAALWGMGTLLHLGSTAFAAASATIESALLS